MSRRVNTTHELIWSRIAVGRCSLRNTGCTNMVPGAPIESEIHTLWGRPGLSLHTRLVCGSPRQKSPPIPPKKPLFRVQCLISRPPRARPRFSFFFLSRFYRDFLAKRAPNKNLHNRPPFNRPPFSGPRRNINQRNSFGAPMKRSSLCPFFFSVETKLFSIYRSFFFLFSDFLNEFFWMTADYKWHVAKFDEKERKGIHFLLVSFFLFSYEE